MSREIDAFEFMQGRNQCSDAVRGNDSVRSDLIDLTLELRAEKPRAIAVSDPAKPRAAPWIWLPRTQIEIERKRASTVVVTLPEWPAKQKGLV